MTVRIPISADPSGAVQGFEQIRAAIQRAGQAGRQFSDLDLSHPELKDFAADIRTVREQFEGLKRISGGLRTRIKATGQGGAAPWDVDYGRMYEDPGNAARARGRAASFATTGTQFAASGVQPPGGGGRGGFPALPVSGGSMGGMLKFGLGLAGIGGVAAMLSKSASQGSSEAIAVDDLQRSTGKLTTEFDTFSSRIRHLGEGLGVASTEAIRLASVYARASAEQNVGGATRDSVGFARGFGMSPAMAAQFFGQMRFAGASGEGRQGQRELAAMIADAVSAGGMTAKTSELMSQLASFVATSERTMVRSPDVGRYLALTSAMNANQNTPGLHGAGGAALIAQIDAAIRGGGRFGEAGQMFMYRALSQEGEIDPYEMRFRLDKGIFGTGDEGGPPAIQSIVELIRRESDDPNARADALANLLGITITQAAAFLKIKPSSYGALGKLMGKSGIDYKSLKASAIPELAAIVRPGADLEGIRDRFVKEGLTPSQSELIKGKEGEDLRGGLAQIVTERGMIQSDGSRARTAMARIETAIGDLGSNLLVPLNVMREALVKIAHPIDSGQNWVSDGLMSVFPPDYRSKSELDALEKKRQEGVANWGGKPNWSDALDQREQTIKLEATITAGDKKRLETTVKLPIPGSVDPANAPGVYGSLF